MKNSVLLSAIAASVVFAACQSNETGNSKDVSQDQIYRNYEVTIDEEKATATVGTTFRFAGENGTTLRLNAPSKVTANGTELVLDSLLFGGAYYKSVSPIAAQANKVEISFTDSKESTLNESFEAGNGVLQNVPDTIFLGKDFSVSYTYSGGEKANSFEVAVTDSKNQTLSFYATSDAEKSVNIPGSATDSLAVGELSLQLISHARKELDNHNSLGGKIDFSCEHKPVKVVAVKN